MVVYAMDKEYYELKRYEDAALKNKVELTCFSYFAQLNEAIENVPPDAVFLEAEIVNLAEFTEEMREKHPKTKLIFTTKRTGLTPKQLNLHPDGWITKPITEQTLQKQLFRIRHPRFFEFGAVEAAWHKRNERNIETEKEEKK